MNESEFQKMMLKNKLNGSEDPEAGWEMAQLCESEDDLHAADSEDLDDDTEDDGKFFNLTKYNGRVIGKE